MNAYVIPFTVAVLSIGIYLIPSPIDPQPYTFRDYPPELIGPLKPNYKLQKAKHIFENVVIGPETFTADKKGYIYTGSADGKLWRFKGDDLQLLGRTGVDDTRCGSLEMESVCGRPKGMKVDSHGNLIFVDAYKGLMKMDLVTMEIEMLVSSETGINGVPFMFLNSIDITSNGTIYFTDSTTRWTRKDYRFEVIETNHLGRLLSYDPRTKTLSLVLDNLYLANGIALSQDESYILIQEMSIMRILKYYLKGPRAGSSEVIMENMAGYPDNIKLTKSGTFHVAMGVTRFRKAGILKYARPFLDVIGPYPALKRLIAKLTPLWAYSIFLPRHNYFLEIDGDGNILKSFHDPDGKIIRGISEVFEHDGRLYIGHHEFPYVSVMDVKDLED
ncbi:adipocyte plasma membrane-associated protein-like [Lineus longissimus]|uniref:adipocyte plasma membrane-associated protein-like n=1 Tax=Lineus longissimus TaxID=88925 RepID=UPI002B4D16DB